MYTRKPAITPLPNSRRTARCAIFRYRISLKLGTGTTRFGRNLIREIHTIQIRTGSSRNLAIPHNTANSMVSQCANPACAAPLRHLREGRLFQFEVRSFSVPGFRQPGETPKGRGSRQVTHLWLCGQCSSNLTLTFEQAKGVTLAPLPDAGKDSSAASQQASS